jgi:hypothetical protein
MVHAPVSVQCVDPELQRASVQTRLERGGCGHAVHINGIGNAVMVKLRFPEELGYNHALEGHDHGMISCLSMLKITGNISDSQLFSLRIFSLEEAAEFVIYEDIYGFRFEMFRWIETIKI